MYFRGSSVCILAHKVKEKGKNEGTAYETGDGGALVGAGAVVPNRQLSKKRKGGT